MGDHEDRASAVGADEQQLRLALVMNGGVSLAVWMGGVTRELDRLRSTEGDNLYIQLLRLTRTKARIDVIAGASAGGINGAVLALAVARGTDVQGIRSLWMINGALELLLRHPFQSDAPSLLKGDAHLLKCLREAFASIGDTSGGGPPPVEDAPVHLSITGTTLKGQVKGYADHFGAVIPDVDHRALFTFRRGRVGEVPDGPGEIGPVPDGLDEIEPARWPDHFQPTGPDQEVDATVRLALAARSSASFPAAFEPSFCPTNAADSDAEHPSMAGVASFDDARWVIDGGVLVNTPFRPALDAIASLPAEAPVRRVLAYVVPHPIPATIEPDRSEEMPNAVTVVGDAVSRLPRVQSIGRELEEIENNNRRVRKRRDAREFTLAELDPSDLRTTAQSLLPGYVALRRSTAADDIAMAIIEGRRRRADEHARRSLLSQPQERLSERRGEDGTADPVRGRERTDPWRGVPDAREVEQLRVAIAALDPVPWLPPQELPFGDWARHDEGHPWAWGFAPVQHAANVVLQGLRRSSTVRDDRELRTLRSEFHQTLILLRRVEQRNARHWRAGGTLETLVRDWGTTFPGQLAHLARSFAEQLQRFRELQDGGDMTGQLLDTLVPPAVAAPGRETTLRRLLALDVVQRSSGAELTGIEQAIELVLVSADAGNAFRPDLRAEDKLAGLQANHFGAFFKQSWRASDWMWGRLDGADRLVRTLLDPRRIHHRLAAGEGVKAIRDEIRALACMSTREGAAELLAERWTPSVDEAVLTELSQLEAEPTGSELPAAYRALQRRAQLEIVLEEIPELRQSILTDLAAGAIPGSKGAEWASGLPPAPLNATDAIKAFTGCPVASETIGSEIGGDQFTRLSTTVLAVAGSVAKGALSVFTPLRPVLAALRGVLLALYLLGRGVVTGGRSGSFAVALVLGIGGALVALFLLGVQVPGLLVLLGTGLLLAGIALGVIRRTWVRIGVAVLLFFAAAGAYRGLHDWEQRHAWAGAFSAVTAVVIMVLAAMLLGLSGRPSGSSLKRLVRPWWKVLVAIGMLAAGVLAIVLLDPAPFLAAAVGAAVGVCLTLLFAPSG